MSEGTTVTIATATMLSGHVIIIYQVRPKIWGLE